MEISHPLREPCPQCKWTEGRIDERNGQACVFCASCGKWLYNAPKKERGLVPESVRTQDISPSLRYKIMERARFRCEFCGKDAAASSFHVGHIVSVKDLRTGGLPEHFYDDPENLLWLCSECNLGQGSHSLTLHEVLVFTMRRQTQGRGDANNR